MTKTRYLKITSHAEEHIERLEEFKDSIFNTVYEDLYNVINRIVREKDRKRGDIITLTGNRGSGKSTVMDSFVKSLNEYDNPYLSGVKRDDGIGFSVLESLDASLLESEEDVFDIILARMLKNIESTFIRTNNNQGRISEEKAEILEQFDHIFGSHQIIKEQKKQEALKGYSPLSALKHFADSQGLAEQFHLLVKKYLHLMLQDSLEYKKTCGQTYLVIPIDDLDMNVEHGFHSLEQIYRYLAVKNVIVVLTIKYEQMEYLLEKDAHKLFPKINREFEPDKLVYIENFSREYLEKMLPVQRRVYMPDMNRWAISQNESWLIKDGEEEKNIKTSILFKICKNTGMYFDICGTKKHFLEPESLRELNGYYEFLRLKMLSPNEEEKKQIMLGNCNHFIYDVCNRLIFGKLLKDYREEMLLLCK